MIIRAKVFSSRLSRKVTEQRERSINMFRNARRLYLKCYFAFVRVLEHIKHILRYFVTISVQLVSIK